MQRIIWKQFNYLDMFGRPVIYESPYLPHNSHDLLLLQIELMPKKSPISMSKACILASTELSKRAAINPNENFSSFFNTWVSWLSNIGYHIELTGDEFMELESQALAA